MLAFGIVAGALPVGSALGQSVREGPGPIPEFSLNQMTPTVEIPRGERRPNQMVIDATPLPRDKSPQIDYRQQTSNFAIGQVLVGGESQARGPIIAVDDRGVDGTITLGDVEGEFVEGEPLTSQEGGAAVADGPLREGVWVLDFAFKPLRTRTIDVPNVGRRTVLYLYYRVVNRTGKPRMFVPQFFLETDEEKRFPDKVIPQAVDVVKNRENPTIPLLGAAEVVGMIPPSAKQDVDDAVFGVAFWILENEIARSDSLAIYVRGLSDGLQIVEGDGDGEGSQGEQVRHKTLKIGFASPGDEFKVREREFRLLTPPYEWIYD